MPYALLSVFDKTGLIPFAQLLHQHGWQLLASGSTAQVLREQCLPVTEVADYTGSPEILQGRVKTLHPAIHAGLLARTTAEDTHTLQQQGWNYIDLVVVNLYPFVQTIANPHATREDAIEQIDIGGVALIRAAAKNYTRVTVICDQSDYASVAAEIRQHGTTTPATREQLAYKAFTLTSQYDSAIAHYFSAATPPLQLTLYPQQDLRYGENPHQQATLYNFTPHTGVLGGELLQGKALSYNNLLDIDVAWRAVSRFTAPAVTIVKHLSPCGLASGANLTDAWQAALACDPVSAFGGIIACNQPVDAEMIIAVGDLFIEAIAAPNFTDDALQLLQKRKNCRVLTLPFPSANEIYEWRSIGYGILRQTIDKGDPAETNWRVVSQRVPSAAEWQSLRFAWRVCEPVRSNAIVLAQGEASVGIGGGLPNRIDCLRLAATRAREKTRGAVMASDAFFPFTDCVELAAAYGISAIIHPGGALRDAEVIAAADKADMAMVMTGVRHFRH